ncbi:sensor histidine kinase [Rufibacter roseus]|uniref:histidine kinase n=1 Tax=Rufibacter roseus TaxID=1567108 RepID=A0ABW2DJ61_9BACT|nr:GAF domain-containing sensor histidine kinase [Rufibacter roseus]
MITPTLPANEPERLRLLQEYDILDSLPEKDFDEITRIASQLCQTPIALISFIDCDRQFFKSKVGLDVVETSRDVSFCAHSILNPEEVLVVHDTRKDERFAQNPFVLNPPHVTFYAGAPLVTSEGIALGTLCVVDQVPRTLEQSQIDALRALANQVVAQLELRKKLAQLNEREKKLQLANEQLDNFASIVSHDLKAPLNNIVGIAKNLEENYAAGMPPEAGQSVRLLHVAASRLREMVNGVLEYSRVTELSPKQSSSFNLSDMVSEVVEILSPPQNINVVYPKDLPRITTSKTALQQIFLNLLSNAIHYNDKALGTVEVQFVDQPTNYEFTVIDNGRGIPQTQQKRIFRLFQTFRRSKNDNVGTGIGLSTVKKLVEKLGGEVNICSEPGQGTTFSFTIQKNTFSAN